MHYILEKILKKRGINDLEELDKEEKATFETWQATLSKDELTPEDIKVFLQSQISIIEGKWANIESENKEKLIPYHTCYKLLLAAINSPKSARDALEKNLLQLIQ